MTEREKLHELHVDEVIFERIPVFLMNGEAIVEVVFYDGIKHPDDLWSLSGRVDIKVTEETFIDRQVMELPDGCFEQEMPFPVRMWPGDTLTLEFKSGGGRPWRRCRRSGG